ncbi:MAG TPA: hypothetical protein PKZ41_05200, partial [Candidatus Omnitrophota bacterium]|nr:hypothetical protein [Candidatus Omnitrophota bacterium]
SGLPTREGRLSVFWGDQILLNERNVRSDNTHHIEIFAQPTELDESIRSYGVIIPSGAGECRLREKLRPALIKKLFPDAAGNIYRSIGSFSITLEAFGAFAASEKKAAIMRSGELNTDSGWWQALTSEMEEYVDLLSDKGLSRAKAEKRWKKTRKVRDQLVSAGKNVSPRKELIGFVDTGAGSLWIDCGRSSSLFENMLLLTKNTPEAVAARKFFGLDREFQVSSDARGLISENSAVIASKVGRGRLKNCVVVASDIAEAEAEDSVIIGSVVTRLNAGSALCYNVVSSREKLGKGDVAVNVFHPDRGRIVMKTHVTRDGQEDWAKKVRIGENSFSYPELSDLVGGVSEEDIKKARMSAVKAVKKERKNNAEHS